MNIDIDSSVVTGAVQSVASQAIREALNGWELKKQLTASVAASVESHDMIGAIARAVDAEIATQARTITAEIVAGVAADVGAAVRLVIQRNLASMVEGIEPGYRTQDQKDARIADIIKKWNGT